MVCPSSALGRHPHNTTTLISSAAAMQPSEIPSYPVSASTSTMNNPQDPALSVGAGEAQTFRPVPLDHNAWQHMTRTVEHYERLEQIGEGTYGQVYRARCRDSGRIVALKKMRIHHGGYWGMPLQFIREIKILKRLQHPNLLQMIEVVTSKSAEHLDQDDPRGESFKVKDKAEDTREAYKGNLFLVLEYVDHDLTGLLDIAYQFTPVQIKCIFKQLLEALAFMHQNKYVRCLVSRILALFALSNGELTAFDENACTNHLLLH